jgi:hypothetical protein
MLASVAKHTAAPTNHGTRLNAIVFVFMFLLSEKQIFEPIQAAALWRGAFVVEMR